jgi:hypothetical protein
VATWVEELQEKRRAPGVKQQLAVVRMLFDWLITGQVVPTNPAAAVRGPKYVVTTGKTPVLDGSEWRRLLDAIPTETVRDLRDRALIGTLTYSLARIGAALKMKVEDLRPNGTGWQIHLHEKGGKEHKMPCHHALSEMQHAYVAAAGIADDRKGWLFRTSPGHTATLATATSSRDERPSYVRIVQLGPTAHRLGDRQIGVELRRPGVRVQGAFHVVEQIGPDMARNGARVEWVEQNGALGRRSGRHQYGAGRCLGEDFLRYRPRRPRPCHRAVARGTSAGRGAMRQTVG